MDGLLATAGRVRDGGGVGHVTGGDVEVWVVRVDAERREVLPQRGWVAHEGADPVATLEEALDDVHAEEAGCARDHDDAHDQQCGVHVRRRP